VAVALLHAGPKILIPMSRKKKAEPINAINLGNYGRSLSLANIEESRIQCHIFEI
jgi:hypothetical protein